MVGLNSNGPTRNRVMKLIEEKDRIEREIRDQTAVLETNNVGMHDPLVDDQGFPRNDIDVYRVRHARHQILCLQNDHKAIMKRIEQGLAEVHSELQGANGEGPSNNTRLANLSLNGSDYPLSTAHRSDVEMSDDEGFAKIGFVEINSPADQAGLSEGDAVLQFGSVNTSNFADMSQINDIVAHSVGQPINVKVKRSQNVLNLTVVPRPWQKPGLLGCHIRRRDS